MGRNDQEHQGEKVQGCMIYLKRELPGDVHSPQLHVHGHDLHGAHATFLHGGQEVIEVPEGAARPPDAQADHVGHVFRLAGT